ncbi:hypothetical protein FQR65_LT06652 [Abscondita terminalis]|nr:hypothetical protein FQR65_LT06652 [Abscondita terminalis]
MAPRRSVRSINIANNYNNLTLNDVLCPICRSILIEPVSLPCNHGFCSSCFEGTVANTNLVCPLCRIRIGSWLRTSRKDNKMINNALWNVIQKSFPKQVKNKLDGVEEYQEEVVVPRRISVPGEIGREYEEQRKKNHLELIKEREAESRASEEYIKKLREQDEYEETVRKENLRLSEQVAKKLTHEYCFDPGPSSSGIKKQGPIDKLLQNLNQKVNITIHPKKEYTSKNLCQKPVQNVSKLFDKSLNKKIQKIVEGDVTDSNDSIDSECRHFKPIEQRFSTASKKVPLLKVPAVVRTASTVIIGPPKGDVKFEHSNMGSAFALVKISVIQTACEPSAKLCDTTITEVPLETKSGNKRKRLKSPPTFSKKNRTFTSPCLGFDKSEHNLKPNGAILPHSIVETNDLKRRQEEDDFLFAKKLQEELNGSSRYYTRNNLSVHIKNVKKPRMKRQVTLKEIMSQTVNKVPQ